MRRIDLRVPAIAGLAILLLAFAPGAKAQDIVFVPGTGEAPAALAATGESKAAAELDAMAQELADPHMQDGIASMAERIGERVLDLPVGKFAAVIERARPGTIERRMREDATLADLAGRDAERLPRDLAQGSRQAMTMLSGFASAFADMMPQFEALARGLDAQMKDIHRRRN